MHETNQSPYRIAVAVAAAVLCHALLLIVLGQLKWQPEPESQRRIPFTLIASAASESETSESIRKNSNSQEALSSVNSDSPIIFRKPDSLPERPRNIRSPSSDTSWIGKLFSSENPNRSPDQEQITEKAEISQVSTQEIPILGPYHLRLIQILARSKYHDKQYEFASLDQPRRVVLNLKLHSSGALVRVNVDTSSGDEELDAAAQRSAYAASPFPPPPASDGSFNYIYPIEIQYQPRQEQPDR